MLRSIYHKVVTLIAAFIKAHTSLRVADEVVFALLQLECVDIKLGINIPGIEQELMGRDAEQGLGVLPDALDVEVLQILRGNNNRRILFAHTLGKVPNVFHSGEVRKEQIELINAGGGVAIGEKLVAHVGQNVEQKGVFQAL